jgi:hypothetical protein
MLDEWAACGIETASDIKERFVDRFYFGCEADDPLTSMAFNTKVNPFGAELNAMMGSDIAHWDVPDMTEVLEEAWEMVDHGWIDEDAFRSSPSPTRSLLHRHQSRLLQGHRGRGGRRRVPGPGLTMLDMVLRGGTVVDGSREPGAVADVGIVGDRIVAVGVSRRARRPDRSMWTDPVVCPGSSTSTPTTTPSCCGTTTASPSSSMA